MKYHPTAVEGAYVVEIVRQEDARGFFARTFCGAEFERHGLAPAVAQCSVSWNERPGTLRGLHAQRAPYEEVKLVRCTRGAVHDVIVDLRVGSPTYLQHVGVELSERNRLALYVPRGVVHGFLTLEEHTEVFYQMSDPYVEGAQIGYRWDDPAFAIRWPAEVSIISPRDASFPDFVSR
jgi:dTDP-4-dehydrorhamnose 3,5-epimerase